MTRAFLALGSNLGDRPTNLSEAVDLLDRRDGVVVVRSSRVYETAPVGPSQPDDLNAVVEIGTSLSARTLLRTCLEVELAMGRERGQRWGPRVIDIDLLTFGDEEIDEPGLTVPHPRMHERGFVLIPLLELVANPPLPGRRSIGELRLGPEMLGDVRPFAPPLTPRTDIGGPGRPVA
ncbi:MAG: 2-amino-4-hydroxy-6-hydroxymethyldihydropteridine diphosphokinase [Actinomycetota bacterium]